MNTFNKIGCLVIFSLQSFTLFAQAPLWDVIPTPVSHTISFKYSKTLVDSGNFKISNGDILGVFYNSSNGLQCAGKITWNWFGNMNLTVYGKDSTTDGFKTNESFKFKIWSSSQNCIVDYVQAVYYLDSVPFINVFKPNGYSIIKSLQWNTYSYGYDKQSYCDNQGIIVPKDTTLRGKINYSCAEMPIDQKTGQINLNGSYAGLITVQKASQYCLSSKAETLNIISSPKVNYSTDINACANITPGKAIEQYVSKNSVGGDTVRVASSSNVSQNIYNAKLISKGCSTSVNFNILPISTPRLLLTQEQFCESVRLKVNNVGGTILWQDKTSSIVSVSANEIEVTKDVPVSIKYIDPNGCFTTDTVNLKLNKLELTGVAIDQQNADCYREGEITIKSFNILNKVGDAQFKLKNSITNEETSTTGFLKEGKYQLYVQDSRGCITQWKDEFTILKDCLTDNPVFSPNNDGKEDNYYIPYEGTVFIYSKNGQLVSKFAGPAYWSGTDNSGNKLTTGIYLMVTGQNVKTITVLR